VYLVKRVASTILYNVIMKIGDTEVLTLKDAGARIGVSPNTLLIQIRNGVLDAERMGKQWVVTADALAGYDERRKVRGFARVEHPLHGKRGGGGRRKKDEI